MTSGTGKSPVLPVVKCILCTREYDRKETEKYRPLGTFENYCLCEDCLTKDKKGWGWRQ